MLDRIRQHRQMTGYLLMPVLLLVWLSFSCQNCFADTQNESAQKVHAAMDCCPADKHSGHSDPVDASGCDNNYLLNQAAISDEGAVQLTDFQVVLLPVAEIRFEATYPDLTQPPALGREPEHFSDRLFSSYRILLI